MFGFLMRLRMTLSKIGGGKSQSCCRMGSHVSSGKCRRELLSRWLRGLNGDMLSLSYQIRSCFEWSTKLEMDQVKVVLSSVLCRLLVRYGESGTMEPPGTQTGFSYHTPIFRIGRGLPHLFYLLSSTITGPIDLTTSRALSEPENINVDHGTHTPHAMRPWYGYERDICMLSTHCACFISFLCFLLIRVRHHAPCWISLAAFDRLFDRLHVIEHTPQIYIASVPPW